jgi:hypothetical protein
MIDLLPQLAQNEEINENRVQAANKRVVLHLVR